MLYGIIKNNSKSIINYGQYAALFNELKKENPHFDNVPGLVYKENNKIITTPHPQKIDFNKFPNPARHLLPNELYAEFPTERRNFTVMVTSLGCPFRCKFCEANGTQYAPRSPEIVVKEIEECYYDYGIREIDIFDYEFTGIKERVLAICKLLQSKNIDIRWACRSRVDTVDEELLREMRKAGCSRIYFGIESGDQEILNRVNKKITLKQIWNTIGICKELGIKTLGFFLVGAPGDNKRTVKKTLKFANRLDLDYVQFSKCLAKPLTSLWKDMVTTTGKDYWKDWVLGLENDRQLSRPWTVLTNREIDKLVKYCYIRYYTYPTRLFKLLFQIRTFYEFKRKLFAFFDMIFSQKNLSGEDKEFRVFNENDKYLIYLAKEKLKQLADR